MEVYRYRTGVVSTEQDLVTEMDTFLTSYIGGWVRIDAVTDSASDRDYVWASDGEDSRDTDIPGADPIVIRARGYNNNIEQYTYGTYPSFAAKTFEIYNSSYTKVYTGTGVFRYWMYGNKNFVCYIIETSPGASYVGYLGLIDSFYVPENDPLPIANRGQTNVGYYLNGDLTFCAMHSLTSSGLVYYENLDWWTGWLQYDFGNRSSSLIMLPTLLRIDNSAAGADYECRGSMHGIYQVSGYRVGNPSVVTTTSGVFITFKCNNSDNDAYAFGPVASGVGSFPGLYINTTGYSP